MVEAPRDRNETIRTEVFSEDDEAVILSMPSTPPSLPPIGGNPLRFASGEAVAPRAVPAEKLKVRARRRTYSDLFDLAVIGLIIACAAVCTYRIFWAVQP